MTVEAILRQHQRCKEITRLQTGSSFERLKAGLIARTSGWRIWNEYRKGRVPKPEPLSGQGDLVVSLTSFPKRINEVWMVIDLLMRQETRPADIVLCLYEGDFPDRKLPDNLYPYILRGLTILWSRSNLMPHLKYYYTFRREMQGPKRCVVTVDDDLFYAPDTLTRLAEMHKNYPRAICGNIVRQMNNGGYTSWTAVNKPCKPSFDKIALGFGAVLYPPEFYAGSRQLYDKRDIKPICLKADDLWLKYIENKMKVKVVTGEFFAVPPEMPGSQKVSLSFGNVSKGGNDEVWRRLKTETRQNQKRNSAPRLTENK